MRKFTIIGMDDNPASVGQMLSRAGRQIGSTKYFSGGKRHHSLVKGFLPSQYRWIDIVAPLDGVFAQYAMLPPDEDIVIFASGDPLFFGFAITLKKRLPDANIEVFPYFNSLQLLAHRFVMPYDDMQVVSLTGRPWHKLDQSLIERKGKIGLLTDRVHTPVMIARRLLRYGFNNYKMYVGEALGGERERLFELTLQQAAEYRSGILSTEGEDMGFSTPNCVILERKDGNGIYREDHRRVYGIPHSDFTLLDGRVKMITKMPVRLLSLSMMNLYSSGVMWDIGFCTGSVSIEAKTQFPHLIVESFEIREACAGIIEENCRKMGVPGISCFIGDFTRFDIDAMLDKGELHHPDAVFIGGHGGKLDNILCIISKYIREGGAVVFNSVNDPAAFVESAQKYGFAVTDKVGITVDDYNKIICCKAVFKNVNN